MAEKAQAQVKPAAVSAGQAFSRLLQRKCSCGTHTTCEQCDICKGEGGMLQRKALSQADHSVVPSIVHEVLRSSSRAVFEPHFGRDFSHVRVHTDARAADSARGLVIGSLQHPDGIFINGPDRSTISPPAQQVPIANQPPLRKPSDECPTDIKVVAVKTLDIGLPDFAVDHFTGLGGYAQMEVSDSDGRSWDGTKIHESLQTIKNTCGSEAKGCSNESGPGGKKGSTFTVGKAAEFLGFNVPAQKNRFYDGHVISMKGSLLHNLGKSTCEIQCQQSYDCAGKQLGPNFLITYLMKKGAFKFYGSPIDLTQIELKKVESVK